jgi:alkylhydroperoxidase family enzyme
MRYRAFSAFALTSLLGLNSATLADGPPTVAATRPEMKQFLEDSKHNQPRLPLPPLTAEEQRKASQGDWSVVNNGRMRKFYLPPELTGAGFLREPDPVQSLGYTFQTMIFWVVSRCNNCTYCMGHQETKLATAGLSEEKIAALDGDWSEFTPAERAALGFAKKLTLTPQEVKPADVEELRRFYNDAQILEILVVTGNFNAMNRWTGAVESQVAPLDPNRTGARACAAPSRRPNLESRSEVEAALASARTRTPLLPLTDESKARTVAPADFPSGPLPEWVRLLAIFPKAGAARIALHRAAEEKGTLDARLKAEIAYTAARHDRAWYALGHARKRLAALGLSETQIEALDGPLDAFPAAERAVLALARKLTVNPALIDDADIDALKAHYSHKQVAEVIHQVTEAAFFDRVTEASRLRLED